MKLIDLHCDTVARLCGEARDARLAANDLAVDLDKLRRANSLAQVFALFVDKEAVPDCTQTGEAMLLRLLDELDRNVKRVALARNGAEIRANETEGKLSAMIAIEEGAVLGGDMENLYRFHDRGVRFVTLTWNYPNEIGFPHGDAYGDRGLTPFGIDLLAEMNRIGVIADVSHLSECGFWNVAEHGAKPFMATHSNCRALLNHSRNLTDEQIRRLAGCGGVMGICVVKEFLKDGADEGRLKAMVGHIKHARNVGGTDVVAIGSDFDGTEPNHELAGVNDLAKLEGLLRAEGFTDAMLEKIFWKNALRVIDEAI